MTREPRRHLSPAAPIPAATAWRWASDARPAGRALAIAVMLARGAPGGGRRVGRHPSGRQHHHERARAVRRAQQVDQAEGRELRHRETWVYEGPQAPAGLNPAHRRVRPGAVGQVPGQRRARVQARAAARRVHATIVNLGAGARPTGRGPRRRDRHLRLSRGADRLLRRHGSERQADALHGAPSRAIRPTSLPRR